MYKFMIADDDQLVRERILSAIPTEKLGLKLCAEAEDGMEALELYERHRPQIVIMDINMPLINGIDAAKQILEKDSDVRIIIVTGFGTVDFAQKAFREGIVDFLLKPIDFAELEHVLQRSITSLQMNAQVALKQQRMERLLEQGMPMLRNKYFLSLMQTSPEKMSEEDCRQFLSDFGITEVPTDICVAIIVPSYNEIAVNNLMSLQAILEKELIKQLSSATIGCIVTYDAMPRIIVVAYGNKKQLPFILEEKISIIRDKMRYLYQFDYHASIGNSISAFHQLQESYQNAEHALGYWSILGDHNIVCSDNVKKIDPPASQLPIIRYREIMDLLVAADSTKMRTTLLDYLNELIYSSRITVHGLQSQAIELLALLASCARDLGENVDEFLGDETSVFIRILASNNIHSIIEEVLNTAQIIVDNICGQREESKSRSLSGAKRFVQQNYADSNLSLAQVAEHVNLSPSYLSMLFKRIDNCTFTEYLNVVRIEQAKKLLAMTHMRVYEVADAVGYQNSKYFFQVFKRITGKRPREFYNESDQEG